MAVLAGARAQHYEVGTNLKGAGTAAAWTLLLPRLDLRAVLVVGSVSRAERAALGSLADRVVVIERDVDAEDLLRTSGEEYDMSIDLVRLGRGGTALIERTPRLRQLVESRLADGASTFVEWRGTTPDPRDVGVAAANDLVLRPPLGPARLIAPIGLASVASRLPGARKALTPAARAGRWRVRADRLLNRVLGSSPLERWSARQARLVTRDGGAGPPAWVAGIAAEAGMDIGASGWVLLAPGDYATQKVLLVLLDPGGDRPRTIVKISANVAHRGRLRAETEALTRLASLEAAAGRIPVVEFAGEHAGREVVGERWIAGRPFEAVASVAADSPQYTAASGWLASLATATVRQRDAGDVGAALRDLFDRFSAVAPLPSGELGALAGHVRTIEAHDGTVPTVFQHGDPGTWNLVLDDADRVVFLDWEAAEPDGVPLWDLFHLQRSFGALSAQRDGLRGIDAGLRHLAAPSPLQDRFAAEIGEQARAIGLAPGLVAPLFFTCWMHRALKEVTRRTPATLGRAPYLRFLRAMLARRSEPAVQHLLGGEGSR